MTDSATIQPKPTDVFVSPLSDFHPVDIDANLKDLNKWLIDISGGLVTLERVETVARNMPVIANIFAAVDLISDIRAMLDHGDRPIDLFDWLNLGLDVIGIIPIPAGTAQVRMGARPMLKLIREEVVKNGKAAGGAALQLVQQGIITAIVSSLQARYAGEIETFIAELRKDLAEVLNRAAEFLGALMNGLADLFAHAAGKPLDYSKNVDAAEKHLQEAGHNILYKPGETFSSIGMLFHDAFAIVAKGTVNTATATAKAFNSDASAKLMGISRHASAEGSGRAEGREGAGRQRGRQDRLVDPGGGGRRSALAQGESEAAGEGHSLAGNHEGGGGAGAGGEGDAALDGRRAASRWWLLLVEWARQDAAFALERIDRIRVRRRADRPR